MTLSGADYHAGLRSFGSEGIKFADDYLFTALQASTQWDALSHAYGTATSSTTAFPNFDVRGTGARRLGIDKLYRHFVGRGAVLPKLSARANSGEPPRAGLCHHGGGPRTRSHAREVRNYDRETSC